MWHLRIGLHTGDVIAGVIGTKRIAYDIWGNTVNVANRMEMSGKPDKVNVSGSTYELIRPYFDCTYRGKVPAKNKGEIDMYFVERIKPHLSEDDEGLIPNQKFKDYVNLHLYSSINYRKAERHIMRILKAKLSPNLHYHGIHHTLDVVEAAERLAIMEGVLDDGIFVLKSAATYHDAGFVDQYDANEPVGAKMAAEILPKYGYTQEQVNEVEKMIYATIIPHSPTTQLEEIICDADLDYLGRDDFHAIADNLRRELRDHGKIKSDRMWDEIQVKFLTQHKYFTKSAIKLRQAKKLVHIEEIKKRLEENNYKD
jgi:predicted metal-dependent HD superfamily phosphohydrolase